MDPMGIEKRAFKIMVVDDSEIVREYPIKILEEAGYTDTTTCRYHTKSPFSGNDHDL